MLYLEHPFQHPDYDIETHKYDIGLGRTKWPMELGRPNAKAIKLPDPSTPVTEGIQLNISGWGITDYIPGVLNYTEDLQIATVTSISKQECLEDHPEVNASMVFCAKGDQGAMVCPTVGDRGGPAANDGILKGIMIATFKTDCSDAKSDLFTDVSYYVEWIKTFIPPGDLLL